MTPVFALAAMLAGFFASANAQTYTSFDALPNGTFPTEMDSSGRIVGTARDTNQTSPNKVFVRNTDGSIVLTDAPVGDWVGFAAPGNIVGR